MEMSERIKKIRIDNKLSQEKFAEILGISRQSVIAYEKGKTIPQTDVLLSICKAFNMELNYFVDDKQNVEEPIGEIIKPSEINEDNTKKDKIIKNKHFDFCTYSKEFKNDMKLLEIKRFGFWQIFIWSIFILILVLNLFIDYIWLIDIPILIVAIIVQKKHKENIYFDHYLLKYNLILNKDGVSLSPQYPVYLQIKTDGIYIIYNKEIIFYCPIEEYDHHVLIVNNKYQAEMLNVNPIGNEMFYSLAIYMRGIGVPYIISFPVFFKKKKENELLVSINRIEYTKCLNTCSMELKMIKRT